MCSKLLRIAGETFLEPRQPKLKEVVSLLNITVCIRIFNLRREYLDFGIKFMKSGLKS